MSGVEYENEIPCWCLPSFSRSFWDGHWLAPASPTTPRFPATFKASSARIPALHQATHGAGQRRRRDSQWHRGQRRAARGRKPPGSVCRGREDGRQQSAGGQCGASCNQGIGNVLQTMAPASTPPASPWLRHRKTRKSGSFVEGCQESSGFRASREFRPDGCQQSKRFARDYRRQRSRASSAADNHPAQRLRRLAPETDHRSGNATDGAPDRSDRQRKESDRRHLPRHAERALSPPTEKKPFPQASNSPAIWST